MKIKRNRGVKPGTELGDMFCGEVVYQVGEGPKLYLVGEGGFGTCVDKRHLIDLEDGSVIVAPKKTLVAKVEGEFVCAR